MDSLFLWAQNLDNSSADHIFIGTRELDPTKQLAKRKEIVSSVSKITANAEPKVIGQHVTIYIGKKNFVLTAILPDLDFLNRKSPILCYGKLADPNDDDFSKEALFLISNFIKRINRTFPLPLEVEREVKQALLMAKKKPLLQRKEILAVVLLLFILLFLLAFLFAYLGKSG